MSPIPQSAFRALHRAAASVYSLAARFSGADGALRPLQLDLDDHVLIADGPWGALAGNLDVETPLRRALARLARNPPPLGRTAQRHAAAAFPDATGEPSSPRQKPAPQAIAQGAPRISAILAESAESAGAGPAGTAPARRSMPRPGNAQAPRQRDADGDRKSGHSDPSTAKNASPARARDAGDDPGFGPGQATTGNAVPARPRRAGAGDGLGFGPGRATADGTARAPARPAGAGINRSMPDAAAVSELLVHGRLSKTSLAGLVARAAGDEPPTAAAAMPPWLQRVQKLVAVIERHRRVADARPPSLDSSADDARPSGAFAAERTTGLRRLAIQAGAELHRLPVAQPSHGEDRIAAAGRHLGLRPPLDDDDDNLSRRLADILRREAQRHGIDMGGVDL
jgi:hypothetical protein